jgi:hypothetical protein
MNIQDLLNKELNNAVPVEGIKSRDDVIAYLKQVEEEDDSGYAEEQAACLRYED